MNVVVVVDRQIQRKKDGPPIDQRWGLQFHNLINMSEVVEYMVQTNSITESQLQHLILDYQHFERWDMPDFAKVGDFDERQNI